MYTVRLAHDTDRTADVARLAYLDCPAGHLTTPVYVRKSSHHLVREYLHIPPCAEIHTLTQHPGLGLV